MTVINTNVGALMARTYAARANQNMSTAMERLSSGQRINRAADDAAGLAVANKMQSQQRGIKMAVRNSRDGISLAQTAESAMTEVTNMVLRMRELSIQMDNGVYTGKDRDNAQLEINALLAEIDKIANNTRFNDVKLLDGSYDQTIRSGNTNAETTRITLNSLLTKDTGSGASALIPGNFSMGPEKTTAAEYNTNFATSLTSQLGIRSADYTSLASNDSEAMLSDLVSSDSFRHKYSENILLLKDDINSIGYQYASVSLTDNQWAQVSFNLRQTKALYEEVESLDALETIRRGEISKSIENLEKERSKYIGSLFHANDIDFQTHNPGNLSGNKYAEVINVYADSALKQSVVGQIAAIEVDMLEVAKNLHDAKSCAHCLAKAAIGNTTIAGATSDSTGGVSSDGVIWNALVTDKNSSGSGAVGPAVGSEATLNAIVTDKNSSGSGATTIGAPSSAAIKPLIMGSKWTNVGTDASAAGAANNLSYSYMGAGHNDANTYSYTEGTRTALETAGVGNEAVHNKVFEAWDKASPFSLDEVDETDSAATQVGDLRVAFSDAVPSGSAAYAYGPHQSAKGGDIYYGTSQMNVSGVDFVKGEYSYYTALHEIGHALGLSHPFDGNSVDKSKMDLNLDRQRNTVMTYTQLDRNVRIYVNGSGQAATRAQKANITTPGLLDIEAIEYLYGSAGWAANTGDTVYGLGESGTEEVFNDSYESIRVISDSGGNADTINASNVSTSNIIDLTPGTYSSINYYATDAEKISAVAGGDANKIAAFTSMLATLDAQASASNSYYPSFTRTALYRGQENVGIAHNTWIENAIGGSGVDTITGNNKGNEITGNGGNDIIDGSGGVDVAIFNGNKATYTISQSGATVTVSGGADGADTLTNIEFLKFDDGVWSIADAIAGNAATHANIAAAGISGSETGAKTGGVTNGESALNINGMTLDQIQVETIAEAKAAILILDQSLEQIAQGRAKLGAVTNRLTHNLNNQTQASMLSQQARGRVVDTDMAVESTKLAQEMILAQAAQQAINMASQRQLTVLALLEA